jgi:hypothetical protein
MLDLPLNINGIASNSLEASTIIILPSLPLLNWNSNLLIFFDGC